ncbi:helix-turn-helix transcriptional regulator [Escherichia coli]|nr:DNA-binding protein [Escherichia coli]
MKNSTMTARQVAELYGVSPHTIHNWVKTIPGFPQPYTPKGKAMRFYRHEVEEFFSKGRQ